MFRLKAPRLEGLCCYATRMLLSLIVLRSANKRLDAHFRMATVLNTRMNVLPHLFSCGEIALRTNTVCWIRRVATESLHNTTRKLTLFHSRWLLLFIFSHYQSSVPYHTLIHPHNIDLEWELTSPHQISSPSSTTKVVYSNAKKCELI